MQYSPSLSSDAKINFNIEARSLSGKTITGKAIDEHNQKIVIT